MPMNIVIAMTPMIASVSAAFLDCGRRNAGTPFEMASTPVSAVAPEENARSSVNSATVATAVASSGSARSRAARLRAPADAANEPRPRRG